ncbi:MAG TPA: DUF6249 domain-containing protein [Steroidobacteraceae bacterium]|nr:DUF6249 domain-containing protein [Steroidobacteraceae bacterium]
MPENAVAIIGVMIPIVVVVMLVGIGMLKLALDYRNRREMFQLHHAERLAAIEKGVEIAPLPPEFFKSYRRPLPGPAVSLRNGLLWLFVGGALFVALYEAVGSDQAWWGLLPAAVGVANLLFYLIAGRKLEADTRKPGAGREGTTDSEQRVGSKP